jgi:hypothetical protein
VAAAAAAHTAAAEADALASGERTPPVSTPSSAASNAALAVVASPTARSGNAKGVLQLLDDAIATLDQSAVRPEIIKQMLVNIKQRVTSKAQPNASAQGGAALVGSTADVFPEDEMDDPEVKKNHNNINPPSISEMVQACDIDNTTKEWLARTYTREPVNSKSFAALCLLLCLCVCCD